MFYLRNLPFINYFVNSTRSRPQTQPLNESISSSISAISHDSGTKSMPRRHQRPSDVNISRNIYIFCDKHNLFLLFIGATYVYRLSFIIR